MKNIIVFAMSTLREPDQKQPVPDWIMAEKDCDDPAITSFEVKDCVSQLEPGVRLIMQNYPGAETELITLNTKLAERAVGFTDFVETFESITPLNYLLHRLYLHELVDQDYTFLKEEIKDTKIDIGKDPIFYTLGDQKKISVCKIVIANDISARDSDDILIATDEIIKEIRLQRNLEQSKGSDINLHIVANGGFREITTILTGILSMLKMDGITVRGCYGADMSGKHITNVRRSFDMFEFVAGLNEFDKYGDVDTLINYFKKYLKTIDVENDRLIKAMRNISNGLNFSNANLYMEGLAEMKRLLSVENSVSAVLARPEVSIFKNDILNDYGDVLSRDDIRYVDIARRCLKKGRLQQALTFIEAKFTEDLFAHHILYFKPNEPVVLKLQRYDRRTKQIIESRKIQTNSLDYICYSVLNSNQSYSNDPVHYIMQNWMRDRLKPVVTDPIHDLVLKKDAIKSVINMVNDISIRSDNMKKTVDTIVFQNEMPLFEENGAAVNRILYQVQGKVSGFKGKILIPKGVNLYTDIGIDEQSLKYRSLLRTTLCLFAALKSTRNAFNHGDADNQPDADEVYLIANMFCDMASILLDRYEAKVDSAGLKTISQDFELLKRNRKNSGY